MIRLLVTWNRERIPSIGIGSTTGTEGFMAAEMFFEDFVIGTRRETVGRTITEADVVIHAGQTGDFYPHHMDAEWCKTQPFGQRIDLLSVVL
jgi:acyl dehydratase